MKIKPIPGWPRYGGGEDGQVYRIVTGLRRPGPVPALLKTMRNKSNGYDYVSLYHDGRQQALPIPKLIALAWLGPRPAGLLLDYKDGDRRNTRPDNLVYRTMREKWAARLARA